MYGIMIGEDLQHDEPATIAENVSFWLRIVTAQKLGLMAILYQKSRVPVGRDCEMRMLYTYALQV